MFWSSEGLSLRFNVGTIQTEGNLQETMKHSFWNTKKTHNGVFRLFSHPVSVACLLTSTNSRTVGDGVLRSTWKSIRLVWPVGHDEIYYHDSTGLNGLQPTWQVQKEVAGFCCTLPYSGESQRSQSLKLGRIFRCYRWDPRLQGQK